MARLWLYMAINVTCTTYVATVNANGCQWLAKAVMGNKRSGILERGGIEVCIPRRHECEQERRDLVPRDVHCMDCQALPGS